MLNIIKRFRNLSIKKKLTISYSLIVVFPVLISLVISNVVLDNFVMDKIGSTNSDSLKDSFKVLNRSLDDIVFTLLSISNNKQVKEVLSDGNFLSENKIQRYEKRKVIDNVLENIPLSLITYDTSITVLGENQFDYGNREDYSRYTKIIKESNWFKKFMQSSARKVLWIGFKPSIDKIKDYSLEAAIPIKTGTSSQDNIGLVHISISEKDIYNALKSNNKTSEIYLIQKNGEILSCENKAEITTNLNSKIDVSKINENIGKWYIDTNKKGEKVVITSVPTTKGDWTLVSIISYEKLIEPLAKIRVILLLLNLIFTISFLVVAIFISNIISKPIIKLNRSMKKVEEGNFNEKVEILSEDEIGKLSQNFNRMLDRVSELLVLTRKQEMLKREAEIEALQAQINPHFLFNTLSSIRWAAAAYGDKKVEEMVHALSVLLRSCIGNAQEMVTIEHEISILRQYLVLMQMKQGVEYTFKCLIEESIMQFSIPHLLLQPIVENSIVHGFEGMEDKGEICITAAVVNDILKIEITDNGKGLKGKRLQDILERHDTSLDKKKYYKNVGLKNILERIKLVYGDKYGLDVRDGEKRGTIVTLNLPFMEG